MPALVEILADSCRRSPFWAFALAFCMFLFSQLALLIPFTILILSIYGVASETEVINRILQAGDFQSDNEVMAFRIIMGGSQLLTWGLAGILMAGLIGKPEEILRVKGKPKGVFLGLGVLILAMSIPLVQWITLNPDTFQLPEFMAGLEAWMRNQEVVGQQKLSRVLSDQRPLAVIVNLVVFAVLPAISEELFFRGFVQKNFGRIMSVHLAIWLTAMIFSLVHFQFYGFFSRLLLGALLGYLVYGSGHLLPAILGHFAYNALSIIWVYYAASSDAVTPEVIQPSVALWGGISLASVAIFMFMYFRFARIYQSYDI